MKNRKWERNGKRQRVHSERVGSVRREGNRQGGREDHGRKKEGRVRENDKRKCEMLKAIRILSEVLRNEIAGGGRALDENRKEQKIKEESFSDFFS